MNKTIGFFVLSFSLTLILMLGIQRLRSSIRQDLLLTQSQIIVDSVETHFQDFLHHIHGAAKALKLLEEKGAGLEEIESVSAELIQNVPSVLGVNRLDAAGVIVRVYPLADNQSALNKISQNLQSLQQALQRGEPLYLSAPFELFQNGIGFSLYLPVYKQQVLDGWIAIVISAKRLEERMLPRSLSNSFHTYFGDQKRQLPYLNTAELRTGEPSADLLSRSFDFMGRTFVIRTWPKESESLWVTAWIWLFLLALVISALATLAFLWWERENRSKKTLDELNQLLRLTIHDTASSLTAIKGYLEMMRSDPTLVPVEKLSRHVSFIIDLLDQIKVIRQLSSRKESWKLEEHTLLQAVMDVSEIHGDRLKAKKIDLKYNPELLADVRLNINKGLFAHSVLGNLLTNAIKFSKEGSSISIDYYREGKQHVIEVTDRGEGIRMEDIERLRQGLTLTSRRGTAGESGSGYGLSIVSQIVKLHKGDLEFSSGVGGGTVARIKLPASL